jgi:flagellar motility protein MotE (MotC chaperone)
VLGDPILGGFTVTELPDKGVHELRIAIVDFLAACSPETTVLVYLSCHGVLTSRRRLYFAASDTDQDRLPATGIEARWLIECLDECKARRQVIILDCCFSGAFALAKGAQDVGLKEYFGEAGEHGRGRTVLTASRATEFSFEGEALTPEGVTGSVFTTALLEGLRTGGADKNQDGLVSVREAYEYAYAQIEKSGAKQTPQRWLYGGEGSEVILTRSPAGAIVEPATLPDELREVLDSRYPKVRKGAIDQLAVWLSSPDLTQVVAAYAVIEQMAAQDIPEVALTARAYLDSYRASQQAGVLRQSDARPSSDTPPQEAKHPTLEGEREGRATDVQKTAPSRRRPSDRQEKSAVALSVAEKDTRARSSSPTLNTGRNTAAIQAETVSQVTARPEAPRFQGIPASVVEIHKDFNESDRQIDEIVRALTTSGRDSWIYNSDHRKAVNRLAEMQVGVAAEILNQLSSSDASIALTSLQQTSPLWCVAVLEAMPDDRARELLRSSRSARQLPLSRSLLRLLREDSRGQHGRAAEMASPARRISSDADLEKIAEQVDRLDARAAAQVVKQLEPESAAQVLDLLGTRKAGLIRRYI